MPDRSSEAFELLERRVQRWIWREGWGALRDVQEEAIPKVITGDRDVVIAAATAAGKTEAAFLPIASVLAAEPEGGLGALYVSPLKALINDQARRLEELFDVLELPVHRWHGDVAFSGKQQLLANPSGVLLITPESLEAIFVRRGNEVPGLFAGLRFIVVDELHAFIGTERGQQLQTLLHRIELAVRRRIPRIALSATLGDMPLACEFLRPGRGAAVCPIVSSAGGQEVRLQVRGYRAAESSESRAGEREEGDEGDRALAGGSTGEGVDAAIARDLFRTLRGGRHLAFANRRADVEGFSDRLRRRCEDERLPNEFRPHHGSLDKALREDAEDALRAADRPVTVIATTTLELGIDVGSVESIAQLGPPPSVASMRQRLGRSGRRGDPAILRIYVEETGIGPRTPPQDQLRSALVQTVAMVRLLVRRWCEPPSAGALHLSTLVQQVLSMIAQHGGVKADEAWRAICGRMGPFPSVGQGLFTQVLRDLASHELITQGHTGELVLGLPGEKLVNHYEFYAAFSTPEEYRLVAGERTLGTLPIVFPVVEGMLMIFGGRRWRVLAVEPEQKVIELGRAGAGKAPSFGGTGALVHDAVRREMLAVLLGSDDPAFLDPTARDLLREGRASFERLGLAEHRILRWGRDVLLFPWAGDRAMNTLLLQLQGHGLKVGVEGVALLIERARPEHVRELLVRFVEEGPPVPVALARVVKDLKREKHHVYLSEATLREDFASAALDPEATHRATAELIRTTTTEAHA